MFLQACVCPHGGGSASVHAGIPHPLEQTPLGVDTPREHTPPRETATAADGTHPTGMHSCKPEISNFEESPQMPTLTTTVKDKS